MRSADTVEGTRRGWRVRYRHQTAGRRDLQRPPPHNMRPAVRATGGALIGVGRSDGCAGAGRATHRGAGRSRYGERAS